MKYWLTVFAGVSAILFAFWLNMVYGQEERYCSRVPLSYAAGRIKAARSLAGKVPDGIEEVRAILTGRVSDVFMEPSLHVLTETADIGQDGFTVKLTTECTFFPSVSKRFNWEEDAFSRVILRSKPDRVKDDSLSREAFPWSFR
jgi:hypothetical protein